MSPSTGDSMEVNLLASIPGGSSVGNKSPVISGISRVNPLITRVIRVITYVGFVG